MSDLRTGLVEAMARAIHAVAYGSASGFSETDATSWRQEAAAALDAALRFLTDNAMEWAYALEPRSVAATHAIDLIAVLSDSRDTGEKS